VRAAAATYQKGAILAASVEHPGAVSTIREDEGVSSGMRICRLSEDPAQTSSLQAEDPGTGEAAIMLSADPKKDVTYGAGNTL